MPEKRIVFRFLGGDQDGKVFDSATEPPEQVNNSDSVRSMLLMTKGGELGHTIRLASERLIDAMREGNTEEVGQTAMSFYKVTEREDAADLLAVTLTFQGAKR